MRDVLRRRRSSMKKKKSMVIARKKSDKEAQNVNVPKSRKNWS